MHISFIVPDSLTLRGGCKRIVEYAMRLGHRGHDVCILTPDKVVPDWIAPYYDGFKLADIDEYRHYKTDIAIATGGRSARRLGRMQGAKVKAYSVVMLESLNKPTFKHGHEIDRDKFLGDPYKQNWIYYANSSWMRDIVEQKFGQKCYLVLAPSNERMKPSLSFKPEGKLWVLGYGGGDWKGGYRTAEAVTIAKRSLPNLEMIHYSQRSIPKSKVIVKHWSSPKQDFLPQIYSSADVFVHSSRFEGWANVPYEAMCCGTPIISFRTRGIEDFLIHDETGLIVDKFEPICMAHALIHLFNSPDLYNKLKINCLRKVQEFNWNDTLTILESIFSEALKSSKFI